MAKKILIVEDDVPLAEIISDKLKEAGFETTLAHNGKEAVDMSLADHPDLILLDIIMPVMDGLTAAKQIRADDWGKAVPIIILTNLGEAEAASQALESNVYDFLVKVDWKIDDVVARVKAKLYLQ